MQGPPLSQGALFPHIGGEHPGPSAREGTPPSLSSQRKIAEASSLLWKFMKHARALAAEGRGDDVRVVRAL